MTPDIILRTVFPSEMPAFRRRMQSTFTNAAREAFPDFAKVIPYDRDIDETLTAKGAQALQFEWGGQLVGGAIVTGDGDRMTLEFIFIDTACQGRHLGYAAWQAIEAYYPHATHWELVTPYYERRNIHFYVNRCGFRITEYFNEHYADPSYPRDEAGNYPDEEGGLFKFEKEIAR